MSSMASTKETVRTSSRLDSEMQDSENTVPRDGSSEDDPMITDPEPTELGEIVKKWPKSTFCIVANEFCERFSFYGMRAVLTLYLRNMLNFTKDDSIMIYHGWTVICYFSPIFGSILADGYIGKFCIGHIVHPGLDLFGLLVIAIGTGGIKPCVSAFGGDQFKPHYLKMIAMFFSVFYFSINAGSTISSYLTPYLRATPCLGSDSCYPLAFGVPAALMVLATVIFMAGSFSYKKIPPKENVIFRVVKTITSAVGNKFKSRERKEHWLDHAMNDHDCKEDQRCLENEGTCAQVGFIEDVKRLVRVCVMMLPIPMFWALYDQQGSTWVMQAVAMNGKITSFWSLLPDQMSTLNAVLIMLFIPIFQLLIFPGVEKMGIKLTSLRKITAGLFLSAVSFAVCGFLQMAVDKTLADVPAADAAHLSIINAFPSCEFQISGTTFDTFALPPNSSLEDDKIEEKYSLLRFKDGMLQPNISIESTAPNCPKFVAKLQLEGGKTYNLVLSPLGWSYAPTSISKPEGGEGQFTTSLNLILPCNKLPSEVIWESCLGDDPYDGMLAFCKMDEETNSEKPCDPKQRDRFFELTPKQGTAVDMYNYLTGAVAPIKNLVFESLPIRPGDYQLSYINYLVADDVNSHPTASQTLQVPLKGVGIVNTDMGAVYTTVVTIRDSSSSELIMTKHTVVQRNHVNILWQIPQYVIITAAEILVSITGIEFAYSEASPELKSVVQAIWLLTVGGGDLIVIFMTLFKTSDDVAVQMFVCGGLMVLVMIIFALLAQFYYEYASYNRGGKSGSSSSSNREVLGSSRAPNDS
ncbi:unnamed protein product [Caenorhabditis auriculariae]|uniref:Peptide transporter family 1 n=1 Tax=Caenorhabditis auriculariae TaxID=2777116 RepID=A0A8S1HVH2_9PELO|nr:unnamed protein product [Caenorhabditis auriculariae]